MKIKFKPHVFPTVPGGNTVDKDWDVIVDGNVVGLIESCIRDLWMDRSNPGYSVTLTAKIFGSEKTFREYSAAFSNRSAKEARENRSIYFNRAKKWATKHFEKAAEQ
jgi:hypothetical protein